MDLPNYRRERARSPLEAESTVLPPSYWTRDTTESRRGRRDDFSYDPSRYSLGRDEYSPRRRNVYTNRDFENQAGPPNAPDIDLLGSITLQPSFEDRETRREERGQDHRSEERRSYVERAQTDIKRHNSTMTSTNEEAEICPILTQQGHDPQHFRQKTQLRDLLKMHDGDLNHILLAYGFNPEWQTWRDNWKEPWARKRGFYPVSIDQLRNLEHLMDHLGATFLGREPHTHRHDKSDRILWSNEVPIRRN